MTLKMIRRGKQKVKEDEQSVETQMEGISSAHSWIKSNTMLRPTKLGKKKASGGGIELQLSIVKLLGMGIASANPVADSKISPITKIW